MRATSHKEINNYHQLSLLCKYVQSVVKVVLSRSMEALKYFFMLLLFALGEAAYDCLVPASFSLEHKATPLVDASFSNIAKLVKLYQVDSHLEVIFVGNSKVRSDVTM